MSSRQPPARIWSMSATGSEGNQSPQPPLREHPRLRGHEIPQRICWLVAPCRQESDNGINRYRRGLFYGFAECILRSFSMPRLTYSKRAAIRQAVDMQKLCYSGAQLLDQDLRGTEDKEERARVATALGNLLKTWTALQESVRILKGDPMPGSFRPKEKPKPTRRHWGPIAPTPWSEPTDPPTA